MLQKLLLTAMLTASLFGVEIVINKSQEMYKKPTFVRNSSKEIVTNTKTGLMWQDDASVKKEFKNIISSNYWSSSPYVLDSYNAWYVNFMYGGSNDYYKTYNYYVRCTRAGQ